MTNLTEQWKKGELPDGEYWCLSICYDIDKLYCYQNSFWKYKTEDDYYGLPVEIKQVLAPVPSYEEWFKIKNLASLTSLLQEKNIECLHRENKLKEQINKCCLNAINRGTANAVKAVKEFGMPERIEELIEQNAQLKELLKEVKDYLPEFEMPMNIFAKIDEALQ